ncbi:MAG: manganese efflux pump MntP family protein [Bariatricus sp.]
MGILEILLISIGLSLDVVVVHVCVGAGFSRPHKRDALVSGILFSGSQLLALLLGNTFAWVLSLGKSGGNRILAAAKIWQPGSVFIFIGLGIYMLLKAGKNETIFERRNDQINWKRMGMLAAATSVDALFAGIGIGFWNVDVMNQMLIMGPITVIQSILGIYIGYRLGCEHNRRTYGIGGILLLIAGIDIAITCMIR